MSAFGTVMAGFFAPNALSLPLVGEIVVPARDWGELRIARVTSNIRAEATTTSRVVGKVTAGDSVRVEAVPNGWYRVYDATLVPRIEAEPLGYIYGRLLEPADVRVAQGTESPAGGS